MATCLFSFSNLADAQSARDSLVDAGFPPECIRLRSASDEAGPVEGNFVIGNGRTAQGTEPARTVTGGDEPYDRNLARQVDHGTQLMEADVASATDARRALALAQEYGGVDVAERWTAALRMDRSAPGADSGQSHEPRK